MNRRQFVLASAATALAPSLAWAEQCPADFNAYVVQAVNKLREERAGGGYGGPHKNEMDYAFTRNLSYPDADAIPQSPPAGTRAEHYKLATMCVAGIVETVVEAINIFMADRHRCEPTLDLYTAVPTNLWTQSSIGAIRPYVFMQADIRNVWQYPSGQVPPIVVKRTDGSVRRYNSVSRGSAHAFKTFKMGEELPFAQLKQGDFINLNRVHGPGHAVVFWSFIRRRSNGSFYHTDVWNQDVVGFEYFAAQGPKWPATTGGFAMRDAFFDGAPRGRLGNVVDPGRIMRQSAQLWLNSGRLWWPGRWDVGKARDQIASLANSRTSGPKSTRDAATEQIMTEELGPSVMLENGED